MFNQKETRGFKKSLKKPKELAIYFKTIEI
jgi:hypothetical protein